jgi:excisionase family DNA binding protein
LTTEELAELLNVTPEILRRARTDGTGAFASLRWHKLGRLVRYSPRDVTAWLAAHERGHAA